MAFFSYLQMEVSETKISKRFCLELYEKVAISMRMEVELLLEDGLSVTSLGAWGHALTVWGRSALRPIVVLFLIFENKELACYV